MCDNSYNLVLIRGNYNCIVHVGTALILLWTLANTGGLSKSFRIQYLASN